MYDLPALCKESFDTQLKDIPGIEEHCPSLNFSYDSFVKTPYIEAEDGSFYEESKYCEWYMKKHNKLHCFELGGMVSIKEKPSCQKTHFGPPHFFPETFYDAILGSCRASVDSCDDWDFYSEKEDMLLKVSDLQENNTFFGDKDDPEVLFRFQYVNKDGEDKSIRFLCPRKELDREAKHNRSTIAKYFEVW